MKYTECIQCGKHKSYRSTSPRCGSCAQRERKFMNEYPTRILPDNLQIIIADLIKTQTLQQLADNYGVSRERIRQILKKSTGKGVRSVRGKINKVKCSTPLCPRMVYPSLKIGNDKCISCQIFLKKYANTKSEDRPHRYFEPKRECKNHPGRLAKLQNRRICAVCLYNEWGETPHGKAYLAEYKKTHREYQNKYTRKYYKRYSMRSSCNRFGGLYNTETWLKNYYSGV